MPTLGTHSHTVSLIVVEVDVKKNISGDQLNNQQGREIEYHFITIIDCFSIKRNLFGCDVAI